eukprot:COSAG01_NODE_50634_length_361_cov_6.114504_1_plen_26_part_10
MTDNKEQELAMQEDPKPTEEAGGAGR